MGIPLDKAELLAFFLESIIYGIFSSFFVILVVVSFSKDPIRIANQRFVLPIATTMMILATTHLILDTVRMMQAFVTGSEGRLPDPIGYYSNIANPLHVVKTVVYALQTILGDGVLVWRCYVVNNRSLFVIIPATVALLANLAIGMVVVWSMSIAVPGENIFQTAAHFIESFFIITMGLNFCCTVIIVAVIWSSHRRLNSSNASSGRSLFPVIAVIIESGAIYTASVMGLLIAYLVGSNGQYPALDLITPLVGVVYCLIILQIHFHLKLANATPTLSNRSMAWGATRPAPSYQLRSGVSVHITEHAEIHTDGESEMSKPKVRLDDM